MRFDRLWQFVVAALLVFLAAGSFLCQGLTLGVLLMFFSLIVGAADQYLRRLNKVIFWWSYYLDWYLFALPLLWNRGYKIELGLYFIGFIFMVTQFLAERGLLGRIV